MVTYPKITSVVPEGKKHLIVTFSNGVQKWYDCSPLLDSPVFAPLQNEWLFKSVQVDSGGYGISWNEEIDLSESELWENGQAYPASDK